MKRDHTFSQIYSQGWEAPSHTATYSHIDTILNSKWYVQWGGLLFPVLGSRSHSIILSQCECDEYGHYIVVDRPHRIPPSGTPAHYHRSPSQHRPHNRLTSHHHHEGRYRFSRSRSQSHPCRYHTRSHSRSQHRDSRCHHRSAHAQMPIHTTLTKTPHIRDYLHTEVLWLTLETTADHNLDQHINQPGKSHTKIHHNPGNPTVLHTLGETLESQ